MIFHWTALHVVPKRSVGRISLFSGACSVGHFFFPASFYDGRGSWRQNTRTDSHKGCCIRERREISSQCSE